MSFGKRFTKYFALGIFTLLFWSSDSSAQAYFKQEQFYDWGIISGGQTNVLGIQTTARETGAVTQLPPSGVLPGHPLYLGKKVGERVRLFFTFNEENKAKQRLTIANNRLAEAKELIAVGKTQEGLTLIAVFEDEMKQISRDFSKLEAKDKTNIDNLAPLLEKATAVHTSVLEEITPQLPEQNRAVVKEALSASQQGMDRAAQALGEPPVPIDLVTRLNSLRGQGLVTQEEATALLQAENREQARNLFKQYVDQGIIPGADFKRFDSAQAKFFSNDFTQSVETRKLEELTNLEKQPVDQTAQKKVEEFAKTYQPGNVVPPELRPIWAKTIRLEEVQKTINPDKINDRMLQQQPQLLEKLQEVKDRVRPTADEVKFAQDYIKNNPGHTIPPEITRIVTLKEKLGVVKEGERPPPGHQEATFLPPEVLKFKEVPYQSGQPTAPPTTTNQNQEFRQPFNPPSPPPTNSDRSPPSYKRYQEQSPGKYIPPPQPPQNDSRSPNPSPSSSSNPPSCPSGSSWNGSTCHFPPSEQINQLPPPTNQSPPATLPPQANDGDNRPPSNDQPPPNNPPPP